MDSDGANPRQLTHTGTADGPLGVPLFTPDGASIVFETRRGLTWQAWKVPVDGGEPVLLFPNAAQSGNAGESVRPLRFRVEAISPDGRWAAGPYRAGVAPTDRVGVALVSMDGTTPWRELNVGTTEYFGSLRWTRDGRALGYVRMENGASNVWLQPLDGGTPRQLSSFTDQMVFRFAWSRDGRKLAVSRGEFSTDVVMITSEEKK